MLKSNVVHLRKPKVFTTREGIIDAVNEAIFKCGKTYQQIADAAGVSNSTIANLASGKTRWPRDTTLFPVMKAVGIGMRITKL